jgi:hypothetical protein
MMYGTMIPADEVRGLVRMLVARYGSIHEAGRVYDERFGYRGRYYNLGNGGMTYHGNGPRLFNRILLGEIVTVSPNTFDQIETLEAS